MARIIFPNCQICGAKIHQGKIVCEGYCHNSYVKLVLWQYEMAKGERNDSE